MTKANARTARPMRTIGFTASSNGGTKGGDEAGRNLPVGASRPSCTARRASCLYDAERPPGPFPAPCTETTNMRLPKTIAHALVLALTAATTASAQVTLRNTGREFGDALGDVLHIWISPVQADR